MPELKTYFYLVEKKGYGWTVKGFYEVEGIKRYAQMIKGSNCQFKECDMKFNEMREWMSRQEGLIIPYLCNLVEDGEIYQVLYITPNASTIKNKLTKNSSDICGDFCVNNTWVDELTIEQLNSVK